MNRDDLVTIAMQGDFGKPGPALVIQANSFDQHPTVTVLPVTTAQVAAPLLRISINPSAENGLRTPSQMMIGKAVKVKRVKIGPAFGRIDAPVMLQVERCLAVFFGIAR